ncbi:hypothetical protein [Acetivibrio straminisolvens]|jgi:hypothetical protein|nr:hypothetical protein [Acetivibrio straminisolvens]
MTDIIILLGKSKASTIIYGLYRQVCILLCRKRVSLDDVVAKLRVAV